MYFIELVALCLVVVGLHIVSGGVIDNKDADRHHRDSSPANDQFRAAPNQLDSQYWLRSATDFVQQQRLKQTNRNRAKNIIMFLGDGMSTATVAATRVYMGGEEQRLSFERFPHLAMSKTYCVDYQVPDSACTSTAYMSGVKANYGTLGVTAAVPRGNCELGVDPAHHTSSLAAWAMAAGKAAGLVTTTRVTHASPASLYAHIADRDWENNDALKKGSCQQKMVDDIAKQLVLGDVGRRLKVVMGGGRREFIDKSMVDAERQKGKRTDGRNLIDEWLASKTDASDRKRFVWNTTELMNVNPTETDYLLGLFEHSHCRYNLDIQDEQIGDREPTLSEMVDKAIDVLATEPQGFFLFVEGGRIDQAHHDAQAHYALEETAEFARAIELARKRLSEDDTLIVTTADHAHTMTYAGYGFRGDTMFGSAGVSALDNLPYLTLSYANGPGAPNNHYFGDPEQQPREPSERVNPLELDHTAKDFPFPGIVPLDSETHGGDDVAVYASGPWSHLFAGSVEQNTIPYMMAYAACVGSGRTMCDDAV